MLVFTYLHMVIMKATFHPECETNTIKKKECKFTTNKHKGSSLAD